MQNPRLQPVVRSLSSLLVLATTLTAAAAASQSLRADGLRVGRVVIENSGASEAQNDFAEGLAALHSFWYDAAREAFRRAQDKDPGFALAYWGEAMSHYRALWSGLDSSAGRRQLDRLDEHALERLERDGTDEEHALIEAARNLFGGGAGSGERAFSEALGDAYERQPESIEIGAFYALSLQALSSSYRRRTEADWKLIEESGELLEELYRRAPDHPGVMHYLIHAYDDPEHAHLALDAARRYASVAPDAGHAQHMPSHIFIQLGEWELSAASNRRAWRASELWAEARDLPDADKDFHSLGWLHYSLLQLGDFEGADEALAILRDNGGWASTISRYQARRLIESEDWDYEVSGSEDESHFARGYAAARRGDLRRARKDLAELADQSGEDAEILALALEGLVGYLDGDTDRGLELLAEAADREEATRIPSGPPDLIKPALELYGEVLLRSGRCSEAKGALDRALARTPGRRLAVRAAEAAASCAGDA